MRTFAGWLFDHKWVAVLGWVAAIATLVGASQVVGTNYRFDLDISASESVEALELLNEHTPATDGDTVTVVWKADTSVDDPAVRERVRDVLADLGDTPHVVSVVDPYALGPAGAMFFSDDRAFGYTTAQLDVTAIDVPPDTVASIAQTVRSADGNGLVMAAGGQVMSEMMIPKPTIAEVVGLAVAGVVLLLAFGSIVAAGMPVLMALIALLASVSVVGMLSQVLPIPSFALQLVALLGLGVGLDYALFVLSRHRAGLMRGLTARESVVEAFDTSGRAVVFAGVTVLISLLGLLVVNIGFLTGLAIAASVGVLFTMGVTITLLPSFLALAGERVLGRRAARDLRENGPHEEDRSTRWGAWSSWIQRRPVVFIAIAGVVLAVLAIPSLGLRLGSADQGSDPAGSSTRVAYDLMAEGFGPGANGPLLLVSAEGSPEQATEAAAVVRDVAGVASVGPAQRTADGAVGFVTVVPHSAPQDPATTDLVHSLRSDVLPQAGLGEVRVSGAPAVFIDFGQAFQDRLPLFLGGVLLLSSVILLVAFRSVVIPLKAAVMNLAVAAASFGVLTAVFQNGWGLSALGVERTGPVDAFLPVLLLAILFGLSMDYQVFLVSRMKEEWDLVPDNGRAVRLGLAETGKVITAAALIMIAVFVAFVFGGERIIKMFGVGLAVAIFLDAFVVRSLLVPAMMQALGKWNWWIPGWLDRVLPNIAIEPAHVRSRERSGDRSPAERSERDGQQPSH